MGHFQVVQYFIFFGIYRTDKKTFLE